VMKMIMSCYNTYSLFVCLGNFPRVFLQRVLPTRGDGVQGDKRPKGSI